MNEELLSLVRDARVYIQARLPKKSNKSHHTSTSSPPKQSPALPSPVDRDPPTKNVRLERPEKAKGFEPAVDTLEHQKNKPSPSVTPEQLQNPWKLHPMPLPQEEAPFFSSLKRYTKVQEFLVPVHILLIEPSEEEQLFLEGLAKAITRIHAPTALIFSQDAQQATYLLAPESFLQKRFADVKLHSPFLSDRTHILPMADYSLYLQDREAKRILWQAIQKLFLS